MPARTLLELKDVTREFKQGDQLITVLQPTNFTIRAGEFLAVVGPSGSGKSTFLTIAGGLQTPSNGTVTVEGVDITNMNQKQLSEVRLRKIGFILQASNLVPFLSVQNQLELYYKVTHTKADTAKMTKLLKDLGVYKLRNKYPSDLSGGEKQRVVIAKILNSDPGIILADEPTASLDTAKAFEVVELLKRETHERGKATIMVTHDERLLKYCDRVYEMHDGMLRERKS